MFSALNSASNMVRALVGVIVRSSVRTRNVTLTVPLSSTGYWITVRVKLRWTSIPSSNIPNRGFETTLQSHMLQSLQTKKRYLYRLFYTWLFLIAARFQFGELRKNAVFFHDLIPNSHYQSTRVKRN